jgi:hypothetical protein
LVALLQDFEEDKKYLKHFYQLRYEDYVENPDKYHQEIAALIGTRVPEAPKEHTFRIVLQQWRPLGVRVPERAMEMPSGVYNKKYFDRWSYFLTKSPFRAYYRYIARKYEPEFAKYRYSLIKGFIERENCLSWPTRLLLSVVRCIAFWQILAPLRGALRCAPSGTQSGRPKDFCQNLS